MPLTCVHNLGSIPSLFLGKRCFDQIRLSMRPYCKAMVRRKPSAYVYPLTLSILYYSEVNWPRQHKFCVNLQGEVCIRFLEDRLKTGSHGNRKLKLPIQWGSDNSIFYQSVVKISSNDCMFKSRYSSIPGYVEQAS